MQALWDTIELPYTAVRPWPLVWQSGHINWVSTVEGVESWLELRVGNHYTHWVWNMRGLEDPFWCGVSFVQERYCSLFLLAWDHNQGR